ncbi:MAG: hypothetical protein ACQSGP_09745 [Frankia sp.]
MERDDLAHRPSRDEMTYVPGGVSLPVVFGVITALMLLFVLMLAGPAGGLLPIAVTLAYVALYVLGYKILRPVSRA